MPSRRKWSLLQGIETPPNSITNLTEVFVETWKLQSPVHVYGHFSLIDRLAEFSFRSMSVVLQVTD
jgi:hypothetical protein